MKPNQLEGKTIKSVDSQAINAWTITFTDGTVVELGAEQAIATAAGNIAGLQITDRTPEITGPFTAAWVTMMFNTLAEEWSNSETVEDVVVYEDGDIVTVSFDVDAGRYGTHDGYFTVNVKTRKINSWRLPEVIEGGDLDGRFEEAVMEKLNGYFK